MRVTFGVLGPVVAWDAAGSLVALKGPRHRAVLARLLVDHGRVVPVARIVEDLWTEPPPDAVGAVRTFVAALRRALEPGRPPRATARLLVTEGPGYALRADLDRVDATRFEAALGAAAGLPPDAALARLGDALDWWRGPAYAEFAYEGWATAECARLAELRLHAVERQAEARLALGRPAEAVPDLDAHVTAHPWREDAWRLLALALYRAGRQGDALALLRRARTLLIEQLGVDPGPGLRRLEADILNHADHLVPGSRVERVWVETAAVYDRTVATGAYDVPAIWPRSDDPTQAAEIVAAAERALALGPHDAARARLLATVALESRGTGSARASRAAAEAEAIARRLEDPRLLAFALNGRFMQTFHRASLAPERDAIGAELIAVSARHGLVTYEVLGHLIRLQARSALADFTAAGAHAAVADRLAAQHELPLVAVFTAWYRALRLAADDDAAEEAYREAAARLDGAGMPGLQRGALPLALLCLDVRHGRPAQARRPVEWGPYEPWAAPLVLLAEDRVGDARTALRATPEPPRDLLLEALWSLTAHAAVALGDRETMERAYAALLPAAGELAGAGSGLLTVGPVADHLAALAAALGRG